MAVQLSVIIPNYMSEQYIHTCLDSIYANTMKGVEVILVNDGSPNFTNELLNDIKARYSGIVVINKDTNEGIGYAYRDAILKAKGAYIMFVDCDDIIVNNAIEIVYDNIKNADCDILQFGCKSVNKEGKTLGSTRSLDSAREIKSLEKIQEYHFREYKYPQLSTRVIKRSLFDNAIFLKQSVGIDELLTAQIISKAGTLRIINKDLYIRLIHEESLSQQKFSIEYFKAAMSVYSALIDKYVSCDYRYSVYIQEKYLSFLLTSYNNLLRSDADSVFLSAIVFESKVEETSHKCNMFRDVFKKEYKKKLAVKLFISNRHLYSIIAKNFNF